MCTNILVGDIIRPSKEVIRNCSNPHLRRSFYGSFLARRPALVLKRTDGYYQDSEEAIIAYKLKTGEWREEKWRKWLKNFTFVKRPNNSDELNKFHNYRGFTKNRHLTIYFGVKCFFIRSWLGGVGITDPDVPYQYGDHPIDPSTLGKKIRVAFSQVHDCNHLRQDGKLPEGLIEKIKKKSSENIKNSETEIINKYNIKPENFWKKTKEISIRQLHDCYVLRKNGYQFTEADEYVSISVSDEFLGISVMDFSASPRGSEKYFRTNRSYLSRVLPFLSDDILNIDF